MKPAERFWSPHTYSQTPHYAASSHAREDAARTLEKQGIQMCSESPEMLHSGGHTSWPFREEQDFIRWTEERPGYFLQGNLKYKSPERLDTACLGEQKDGLGQIQGCSILFRDGDG